MCSERRRWIEGRRNNFIQLLYDFVPFILEIKTSEFCTFLLFALLFRQDQRNNPSCMSHIRFLIEAFLQVLFPPIFFMRRQQKELVFFFSTQAETLRNPSLHSGSVSHENQPLVLILRSPPAISFIMQNAEACTFLWLHWTPATTCTICLVCC